MEVRRSIPSMGHGIDLESDPPRGQGPIYIESNHLESGIHSGENNEAPGTSWNSPPIDKKLLTL